MAMDQQTALERQQALIGRRMPTSSAFVSVEPYEFYRDLPEDHLREGHYEDAKETLIALTVPKSRTAGKMV